ncbi:MAG: hypothetical protein NUV57_04720 [archaeon]|nr:hypothetical protein [archaeon]
MNLIKRLAETALMIAIGYTGITALTLFGITFGPLIYTPIGFLGVANLAFVYTFYFRI